LGAKEEQILEAAKELFSRYGLSKTTVGEIAKAANVGKGTIYLYFTSKEEIFFAVFKRLNESFFEKVEGEVFKETTAYQQLGQFCRMRSQFVQAQLSLFENPHDIIIEFTLFFQSNPEIFEIMEGYLERENQVLAAIIQKGIDEENWEVEDIRFWTNSISCLFIGLDHRMVDHGRDKFYMTTDEDINKLARFLINGMRRKG